MSYELWGLHPANLINTYKGDTEALADVRDLLDAGWAAEDLSLGQSGHGSGALIAEGAALAQIARQEDSGRRSRSV
jgi:hypothetical protein